MVTSVTMWLQWLPVLPWIPWLPVLTHVYQCYQCHHGYHGYQCYHGNTQPTIRTPFLLPSTTTEQEAGLKEEWLKLRKLLNFTSSIYFKVRGLFKDCPYLSYLVQRSTIDAGNSTKVYQNRPHWVTVLWVILYKITWGGENVVQT